MWPRLWNVRDALVSASPEVFIDPGLGTDGFSVGALHDKCILLDLSCTPPVLRHYKNAFPISTEVPRIDVLYLVNGKTVESARAFYTVEDARIWHRRLEHYNPRALNLLAQQQSTGVIFDKDTKSAGCEACYTSNSMKIPHPPSDGPRSSARLDYLLMDMRGKHARNFTVDTSLALCSYMTYRGCDWWFW